MVFRLGLNAGNVDEYNSNRCLYVVKRQNVAYCFHL